MCGEEERVRSGGGREGIFLVMIAKPTTHLTCNPRTFSPANYLGKMQHFIEL